MALATTEIKEIGRRTRTEMNVDFMRELTVRSLRRSLRRCSSQLGLTKFTVQRIIKHDLKLNPCKLEIKTNLADSDKAQPFQTHGSMKWRKMKNIELPWWFSWATVNSHGMNVRFGVSRHFPFKFSLFLLWQVPCASNFRTIFLIAVDDGFFFTPKCLGYSLCVWINDFKWNFSIFDRSSIVKDIIKLKASKFYMI